MPRRRVLRRSSKMGRQYARNLNALLIRKYADMIAQARLKVTATYDDGTTETKTYVITPVDNLEETLRAYGEALRAQAAEERRTPGRPSP